MSDIGPEEKKRRDLIEELYKTEEAYVNNLKLVNEVDERYWLRVDLFNSTF